MKPKYTADIALTENVVTFFCSMPINGGVNFSLL